MHEKAHIQKTFIEIVCKNNVNSRTISVHTYVHFLFLLYAS